MRFVLRLLGFLCVAGGFVAIVIDGTRSIVDKALAVTPLGAIAMTVLRERYLALQPAVERNIHPLFWRFLLQPLLDAPAALVLLVLGFLLIRLGRPRTPGIGYATGRRA